MTLGELIDHLQRRDPDLVIPFGFGGPGHSDRGSYENLAFPYKENVKVGELLDDAKAMLGKSITGYKGGDYLVSDYTQVFIGEDESECGEPISPLLIQYMIDAATEGWKA